MGAFTAGRRCSYRAYRRFLDRRDLFPGPYDQFREYATTVHPLRRDGLGGRFVHGESRDHLADRWDGAGPS